MSDFNFRTFEGDSATFYDAGHKYLGSAEKIGNKIFYKDEKGAFAGYADKVGDRIDFHGNDGKWLGSSK